MICPLRLLCTGSLSISYEDTMMVTSDRQGLKASKYVFFSSEIAWQICSVFSKERSKLGKRKQWESATQHQRAKEGDGVVWAADAGHGGVQARRGSSKQMKCSECLWYLCVF